MADSAVLRLKRRVNTIFNAPAATGTGGKTVEKRLSLLNWAEGERDTDFQPPLINPVTEAVLGVGGFPGAGQIIQRETAVPRDPEVVTRRQFLQGQPRPVIRGDERIPRPAPSKGVRFEDEEAAKRDQDIRRARAQPAPNGSRTLRPPKAQPKSGTLGLFTIPPPTLGVDTPRRPTAEQPSLPRGRPGSKLSETLRRGGRSLSRTLRRGGERVGRSLGGTIPDPDLEQQHPSPVSEEATVVLPPELTQLFFRDLSYEMAAAAVTAGAAEAGAAADQIGQIRASNLERQYVNQGLLIRDPPVLVIPVDAIITLPLIGNKLDGDNLADKEQLVRSSVKFGNEIINRIRGEIVFRTPSRDLVNLFKKIINKLKQFINEGLLFFLDNDQIIFFESIFSREKTLESQVRKGLDELNNLESEINIRRKLIANQFRQDEEFSLKNAAYVLNKSTDEMRDQLEKWLLEKVTVEEGAVSPSGITLLDFPAETQTLGLETLSATSPTPTSPATPRTLARPPSSRRGVRRKVETPTRRVIPSAVPSIGKGKAPARTPVTSTPLKEFTPDQLVTLKSASAREFNPEISRQLEQAFGQVVPESAMEFFDVPKNINTVDEFIEAKKKGLLDIAEKQLQGLPPNEQRTVFDILREANLITDQQSADQILQVFEIIEGLVNKFKEERLNGESQRFANFRNSVRELERTISAAAAQKKIKGKSKMTSRKVSSKPAKASLSPKTKISKAHSTLGSVAYTLHKTSRSSTTNKVARFTPQASPSVFKRKSSKSRRSSPRKTSKPKKTLSKQRRSSLRKTSKSKKNVSKK